MQRRKWLIAGGVFVLICGMVGYWATRGHGTRFFTHAPRVISVPSHRSRPHLEALSLQSSQASAWTALQRRHQTLMTIEWRSISQQIPGFSSASLGQLTPTLLGASSSLKDPVLETPGFQHTIAIWQQDLSHIPHTVAPSGIPTAVWDAAWNQTLQDVDQAVGPDPLALDEQLAPHEGHAFQRLIVHRYALWHTWQAQHAWMTTIFVSVGPFRRPYHRVVSWTVIRPPVHLSTSQLHVITTPAIPGT